MKKNNSYLADDEIDLGDLLRTLWREKILILSISIICGLLGYLYASFKPEEFKTEIKLKNPPSQLFEPYAHVLTNNNNKNNNNNNNNNNNIIAGQFISDFKLNLLSLDNLEIFVEESRDLDTFKKYLKSRNISAKQYFVNKLGEEKEKNIVIPNTYFLVFEKKILDGNVFFNNYIEFIKKKNIIEFKKNLKSIIENRINITENALETAKLINLENPILKSPDRQNQVVTEPEALFYKGTKVLTQSIVTDKRLLQKLENDQFNYDHILDKGIVNEINKISLYAFLIGLFIGCFLSCIIIFFKSALKNK
jgi:LPS O-antigen subunit length determinant protein (WzzB/FepE family)